jgi:hypothetical protein
MQKMYVFGLTPAMAILVHTCYYLHGFLPAHRLLPGKSIFVYGKQALALLHHTGARCTFPKQSIFINPTIRCWLAPE